LPHATRTFERSWKSRRARSFTPVPGGKYGVAYANKDSERLPSSKVPHVWFHLSPTSSPLPVENAGKETVMIRRELPSDAEFGFGRGEKPNNRRDTFIAR